MNNPLDLIKMMMGKMSPEQIVMNMVGNNTNPMLKNLIQMAQKNDKQGLENFARNLFKEQGKNYDEEFNNFINLIGLKK